MVRSAASHKISLRFCNVMHRFLRENTKEEGILSRVVQSFPFFFNLLGKRHHEVDCMWEESSPLPVGPLETKDLKDSSKVQEFTTMKISEDGGGQQSRDLQAYFNAELDRTHLFRLVGIISEIWQQSLLLWI